MFGRRESRLTVLSPLILATNLVLLFGREVVLDIERLPDLLRRLALDHVGDRLAADVEQRLDVHVVRREDDFEEHLLVDLHELLVPVFDVGRLLARVGVVVLGRRGVVFVVLAPFEDLAEDGFGDLRLKDGWHVMMSRLMTVTYVHDWDRLFTWSAQILDHVLDEHGTLGNLALCGTRESVMLGKY